VVHAGTGRALGSGALALWPGSPPTHTPCSLSAPPSSNAGMLFRSRRNLLVCALMVRRAPALWAAATLACAGGLYPVLAFQTRLATLPVRGGPRSAGCAPRTAPARQKETHRAGSSPALALGCRAGSSADAEPVPGDNAREPFELINDPAHEELRQWARGSHSEKCAHQGVI